MRSLITDQIRSFQEEIKVYIEAILFGDKDLLFYVVHKMYDTYSEKIDLKSEEINRIAVSAIQFLNGFKIINFDLGKSKLQDKDWYVVTNMKNFKSMPISIAVDEIDESPIIIFGKILFFVLHETIDQKLGEKKNEQ